MKVKAFAELPEELAARFTEFERAFTYPLGDSVRFSIDHGPDYGLFYRALGEPLCIVAKDDKRIIGTVSVALRSLITSRGRQCAWYIGDLKIATPWRRGQTLALLALTAFKHASQRCSRGFAVMMDGAVPRPDVLGRRSGIPVFSRVSRLHLWSIPALQRGLSTFVREIDASQGEKLFYSLAGDVVVAAGGDPQAKSKHPVVWLVAPSMAVARLEDTELAKRLVRLDGMPIRIAHLGCFAYEDVAGARSVLEAARVLARSRGFDSLMVSMPPAKSHRLENELRSMGATLATATVFGLMTDAGCEWHVNSSEI